LQDSRLHLRLVPGLPNPGRNDDGPIILGHLPIACVQIRLIAAGTSNCISQVVRNEDLCNPLEELEGMDMGLNPGGQILREGGLRKGIIAGSQGCDKDLDLVDFSGLRVCHLHGLSSIVDKEFLSGPVFLAKAGIELFGPVVVEATKLTVLVPLGILLLVFMPEKLKGDALLL
jgi:hypothetical protein